MAAKVVMNFIAAAIGQLSPEQKLAHVHAAALASLPSSGPSTAASSRQNICSFRNAVVL
jgi:hypothetical protein